MPTTAPAASHLAESLEGVEVAARRGTAITRKLLSFSRDDIPRPQTFDLCAALDELHPLLRQLFPPVRAACASKAMPRRCWCGWIAASWN